MADLMVEKEPEVEKKEKPKRPPTRDELILETGKDPRTGLTYRVLELTNATRKRGGRKTRRRTARVWRPVEEPERDSA